MKRFFLVSLLWLLSVSHVMATFIEDTTQGIITDNISGLVWQGNAQSAATTGTWQEAVDYCENLNIAGHNDWRLPNMDEYQTIIDWDKNGDVINSVFASTASFYWIFQADNLGAKWFINPHSGTIYSSSTNTLNVRCVRGGNFGNFDNLSNLKQSGFTRDDISQIVTDTKNTLQWQDYNGEETRFKNWTDAKSYCENLFFGGLEDWRLPSIDELLSIIDLNRGITINSVFKNSDSGHYWSSTLDPNAVDSVWGIYFHHGHPSSLSTNYNSNVRCVRGGQSFNESFVDLLFKNTDYLDLMYQFQINFDKSKGNIVQNIQGSRFVKDSAITIEAIPDWKYKFISWSDGNTENPRLFTINNSSVRLNANFDTRTCEEGGNCFVQDDVKNIVFDTTISQLMWQDDNQTSTLEKTWSEAIDYCENLSLGGFDDWRLPSIDELLTLSDFGEYQTGIIPAITHISEYRSYWSSSKDLSDANDAWQIGFGMSGMPQTFTRDKTNIFSVRCARGGQLFGNLNTLSDVKRSGFRRDNEKEIVIDTKNGLQWQDTPKDYPIVEKTWQEAKMYCENLSLGGFNDWRLPSINELATIIDFGKYNDAINSIFTNARNSYWSATSIISDLSTASELYDYAWVVFPIQGNITGESKKSSHPDARCVRGGPSPSESFVSLVYANLNQNNILLTRAWQLISAPVDIINLETTFGNDSIIWTYDNNETNKWSVYTNSATIPSTINVLSNITAGQGFWAKTSTSKVVRFETDTVFDITQKDSFINAPIGWHLLGTATAKTTEQITEANPDIAILWKYVNGAWQTNYNGYLADQITKTDRIDAGEGFWILVK